MTGPPNSASSWVIGRYAVYGEIASGGMATVHFGRLLGPVGFSRTVAIKRLHPHLAREPEFVTMFLDEARVAARIRHPNVVPTLDVVTTDGQLLLVMDYVQGQSLARLMRAAKKRAEHIPPPIACSIVVDLLHGLHAAHEATNERGEPLGIVHRDVSPQNVIVGLDGVARVLDFGVAKAVGRLQTTEAGKLKGKLAYMAPEQVRSGAVSRLADVYSSAIVLWEALVGERMIQGDNEGMVLEQVLFGEADLPSKRVPGLAPALDEVVMKGLARDPSKRYSSAREMARDLERRMPIASASDVGEWVEHVAGEVLAQRARKVAEIESASDVHGDLAKELVSGLTATAKLHPRPAPPNFEEISTMEDAYVEDDSSSAVAPSQPSAAGVSKSELSNISLSRTDDVPPPLAERSKRGVAILAAVSGGLAIALLVARYASSHESSSAAGPPESVAAAPSESAAPPGSLAAAPSAAGAVRPDGVPSTAPSTAHGIATGAATPPPPRPAPRPPRPAVVRPSEPSQGSRPATKPGCNPPYTVDPDGTKHYKVDCL